MFRNLFGRLLVPLCAVFVLSAVPVLRADEPGKEKEHKEAAKEHPAEHGSAPAGTVELPKEGQFKVRYEEKPGSKEEADKIFDLSKPEDRNQLSHLLSAGHVREMEAYEGPRLTRVELDLGIWTTIVFLLLLAALYKLAWGPMLTGLKKREDSIAGALEAAQKAQEDAKQMQSRLEQQMLEANQKVGALMEETRKTAARTQEEMLAKARADIAAERERLRRELDTARDQALQDLSSYAAKLATDVAAKVLVRELNVADQHRLVEEALGEMRQAAADRNRVLTEA
jgi:F-type H+-transporting ATPase subunit b